MSESNPAVESEEDVFERLFRAYYRDEIAEAMMSDDESLFIEYGDLYRVDPDTADRWLDRPSETQQTAEEVLRTADVVEAVDDTPSLHVRLTDTEGYLTRQRLTDIEYAAGDSGSDLGSYVALSCQLGKVGTREPLLDHAAFECERCGMLTHVPQQTRELVSPTECQGCERQGPFRLNDEQSQWTNIRKVRLESPPEEQGAGELIGVCLDDVADAADPFQDRAGDRVTVLGKLEADMSDLLGSTTTDEPVPETFLKPEVFIWDEDDDSGVDVDDHREAVEEYAARDDAVDLFASEIDPSLVVTEQWEPVVDMATAWLFAAPRIDPEETSDATRGDIHMLFVSDPGMNKSAFAERLEELSPQCVSKDSEGLASSVGLTAAAVRDSEFGSDSWSLKPGALPKANGGHLILDEIDKGPDGFLEGIHSPLEGQQTLNVEKAGQSAELATRVGVLALGNPTEGSFDLHEPISEQVDLHDALMSRFDLIATMQDRPDEETDGRVADGVLDSIDESARIDHGDLSAAEADRVAGEVDREVLQAWVKLAREEFQPLLSDDAKAVLRDYYVTTRDLNDDDSETTPVTARTLAAGWRIATAFARVELSETVTARHAERAVSLSKEVVGLNFDPDTGEFDANRTTETPSTQDERRNAILETIRDDAKTLEEIAAAANVSEEVVRDELETMKTKGRVYQPTTDRDATVYKAP